MIQVVIFDFDDTLMATFESRSPILVRAAADFGYRITEHDVLAVWGKPFATMIDRLMPEVDFALLVKHYQSLMRLSPPVLKGGARQILEYLYLLEKKVLIFSSSSRTLVLQDLEDAGLSGFIDRVWGYEDCLYHKPDPRSFSPIIDYVVQEGFALKQCIFIGDSSRDFVTARGNGILFFGVTSSETELDSFLEHGLPRDNVFASLDQLLTPGSIFWNHINGELGL